MAEVTGRCWCHPEQHINQVQSGRALSGLPATPGKSVLKCSHRVASTSTKNAGQAPLLVFIHNPFTELIHPT